MELNRRTRPRPTIYSTSLLRIVDALLKSLYLIVRRVSFCANGNCIQIERRHLRCFLFRNRQFRRPTLVTIGAHGS